MILLDLHAILPLTPHAVVVVVAAGQKPGMHPVVVAASRPLDPSPRPRDFARVFAPSSVLTTSVANFFMPSSI